MVANYKKGIQRSIGLSMIGFALFIVFYLIASLNYPGGSYTHPGQIGFSITDNYLCDLLDNLALNGEINSSKIYARISLGFLCSGILLFWFHLPKLFIRKTKTLEIMRISGIASMLTTIFLASGNHDVVTRIAGLLGAIAMSLAFVELYKSGFKKFSAFGICCLFLILMNYYMYETGFLRPALPLIQKVTTIACLLWFVLLNLQIYRQIGSNMN